MRLFFSLCLFLSTSIWGIQPIDKNLEEANQSYLQGEKATTFEERKTAFNHALLLYHQVEQTITSPSADLYRALGDTYFQINEYAWAALYYRRALKKEPQDQAAMNHLTLAQEKLGLSPPSISPSSTILSQKWTVFGGMLLLTFLLTSATLWFSSSLLRHLAKMSLLFLFIPISSLIWFYYFTPLEALIITPTGFYREPRLDQPQLTHAPLLAGTSVFVLQTTDDGEWLKIVNTEGLMGYVPLASLRFI